MRNVPLVLAAWLLVSFVLLTGCGQNQNQQADGTQQADDMTSNDPIARGQASYEQYCMSCHGPEGKGNGEIVGELETLPADLTLLRSRYDGTFPVEVIYQTIDGRKEVEAHGTREMPVWGNIWGEADGSPVQEEVIEQRINELIEYIRSIQQ